MDDNGGISQSPVSTEPTEVCFIAITRSVGLDKSTVQKLQRKIPYILDSTPDSDGSTPEHSSHATLRHLVAKTPVDISSLDRAQGLKLPGRYLRDAASKLDREKLWFIKGQRVIHSV